MPTKSFDNFTRLYIPYINQAVLLIHKRVSIRFPVKCMSRVLLNLSSLPPTISDLPRKLDLIKFFEVFWCPLNFFIGRAWFERVDTVQKSAQNLSKIKTYHAQIPESIRVVLAGGEERSSIRIHGYRSHFAQMGRYCPYANTRRNIPKFYRVVL